MESERLKNKQSIKSITLEGFSRVIFRRRSPMKNKKKKILTRSLKSITVKKRLKLRGNKMKSIGMEKLTR